MKKMKNWEKKEYEHKKIKKLGNKRIQKIDKIENH